MSKECSSTDKKDHHHKWYTTIFGHNTELIFAILAGAFYLIGLALHHIFHLDEIFIRISFGISLFFGAYFLLIEHGGEILRGKLNIDFLMLAAAAGAIYIDRWPEAALLLFLFSLGHSLEHYALDKARKNIEKLGDLSPKTALLKKDNDLIEVPVEDLKINDVILVRPNSKIAADGVIISGNSAIDQSSITGESIPVEKSAVENFDENFVFDNIENENKVFTGSINGDNALEIQVLKLNEDSTIARMIEMVSKLDDKKSETQLITQKFEKWYVPAVVAFVVLLCFAFLFLNETFQESLYRAITVLVAASPCALAISTPSAVLSGVARAARSGVLIKGGKALENLGEIVTIAFDKTGTLTEGKPKLTNLIPAEGIEVETFAKIVAEVEELSSHPLAKAIVAGISEKFGDLTQNKVNKIQGIQGMGISAEYNGKQVFIGNEKLMNINGIHLTENYAAQFKQLLNEGNTTMLVAYDHRFMGIIAVMDLPRTFASQTLHNLKEIGIQNMIMLTGDHQLIGDNIARQIGLTEAKGDLLPEDKVNAISDLAKKYGKVAMVGDGVNDAPAMANASVGIAMGAAGSDVALETAEVALMSDKIERLPFVIGLSRASKKIIRQNIWISMGIVALLVPLTLFGVAGIGPAVIMHEGSTLLVVLNALRLLLYKED